VIIRERSCTFRYRVVQVLGTSEVEWADGVTLSAFAGSGHTREFKTLKAAQTYRDQLVETQRWPVMLQVGCMQWLSDDEAMAWSEQHKGDYWE
jgi:hypothetical protein